MNKTITIYSVKLGGRYMVVSKDAFEIAPEEKRQKWEFELSRDATAEDEYNAAASVTQAKLIAPGGAYDLSAVHYHKGKLLAAALVKDWDSERAAKTPYPVMAEFGMLALQGDLMTEADRELLKKLLDVSTKNT